jgi:hypothetical protein
MGRSLGVRLPDLSTSAWIQVRHPQREQALPLITDLGAGETEVLLLGLELAAIVVLDDGLARRVAETVGVKFTGTLGLQLASGAWIAAFLVDNPLSVSTSIEALPIAPVPEPEPAEAEPGSFSIDLCDPNYSGACIPIVNYDLDSPDIPAGPFQRLGADPYRFDADNDGLACERN